MLVNIKNNVLHITNLSNTNIIQPFNPITGEDFKSNEDALEYFNYLLEYQFNCKEVSAEFKVKQDQIYVEDKTAKKYKDTVLEISLSVPITGPCNITLKNKDTDETFEELCELLDGQGEVIYNLTAGKYSISIEDILEFEEERYMTISYMNNVTDEELFDINVI